MERCPACNARLRAQLNCSRCKADLSTIINTEKMAKLWLARAIHFFIENDFEQSFRAINFSLSYKESGIAFVFRGYFIEYQCGRVLDALAEKQLLSAKKILYSMRYLLSYSKQLQKLKDFSDYLLVKEQVTLNPMKSSTDASPGASGLSAINNVR